MGIPLFSITRTLCSGLRLLLVSALFALCLAPTEASAQSALFTQTNDAVGLGVWYGWGSFSIDAPADDATDEVKGYTDIFPSSISGNGPAVGVSFSSWGVNIGWVNIDEDLQRTRADINQTPNDLTDDVTVLSVKAKTYSITLLYQPVRWFFAGYGREKGTMEFSQLNAAGAYETRKLPVDNPYYTFGLAVGFDPTRSQTAPIVTVFSKIPSERTDFNGSTYGAGIGLFF